MLTHFVFFLFSVRVKTRRGACETAFARSISTFLCPLLKSPKRVYALVLHFFSFFAGRPFFSSFMLTLPFLFFHLSDVQFFGNKLLWEFDYCRKVLRCIGWNCFFVSVFSLRSRPLFFRFFFSCAVEDKARMRERVREKHLKRRLKGKDKMEEGGAGAPTLGSGSSSSGSDDDDGSSANSDSDGDDDSSSGSDGGDSGMAASDTEDGDGYKSEESDDSTSDEETEGRSKRGHHGKGPKKRSLEDLEEQEDAVLALLAAKKG